MSAALELVKVSALVENPNNPRKTYDEVALAELARSIKEDGLLQPIVVRKAPGQRGKYQIVCGHRRARAAKLAELRELPALVRELDDRQVAWAALVENLQREDVPPLEEADALAAARDAGVELEEIAARLKRPARFVRERLRLRELAPKARAALESGRLPLGGALLLATLEPQAQDKALGKLEKRGEPTVEGARPPTWPIAVVRSEVLSVGQHLSRALWDLDDETLSPVACAACPKRTGAQGELFGRVEDYDDRCLDDACFGAKRSAWLEARRAEGHDVVEEEQSYYVEGWSHAELTAGELVQEHRRIVVAKHGKARVWVRNDLLITALRAAGLETEAARLEGRSTRRTQQEDAEAAERRAREQAELQAAAQARFVEVVDATRSVIREGVDQQILRAMVRAAGAHGIGVREVLEAHGWAGEADGTQTEFLRRLTQTAEGAALARLLVELLYSSLRRSWHAKSQEAWFELQLAVGLEPIDWDGRPRELEEVADDESYDDSEDDESGSDDDSEAA